MGGSPDQADSPQGLPLALRFLKNLDLAVLLLAVPIFLAADLPMLGYAGGAGAYLAQRGINELLVHSARQSEDLRTFLAVVMGGVIGRGFLVALAILGTGLIDSDAGAASGILFLAAFTIYFLMSLALRPLVKGDAKR